jgi:hypothetical protein
MKPAMSTLLPVPTASRVEMFASRIRGGGLAVEAADSTLSDFAEASVLCATARVPNPTSVPDNNNATAQAVDQNAKNGLRSRNEESSTRVFYREYKN